MRRAAIVLLTCALLTAFVRPYFGGACCTDNNCCGSALCPMKARPAARPASHDMHCHGGAESPAPQHERDCALKSRCKTGEASGILPSVTRAILEGAAILPAPENRRERVPLISAAPASGFTFLHLQPPRI